MPEDFSEPEETEDKDWEWSIKITRIENGYLLEHDGEMGGKVRYAIVEPEHFMFGQLEPEIQSLGEVAMYIWEYFGQYGDKYGEHNLKVAIEKGYKREDYDGELKNMWDVIRNDRKL